MQTNIRIILNEESYDLQLSAPTVFAALREHKEFFCFISERNIEHFDSNQPSNQQNSLFLNLTSNKVAGGLLQTLLK